MIVFLYVTRTSTGYKRWVDDEWPDEIVSIVIVDDDVVSSSTEKMWL